MKPIIYVSDGKTYDLTDQKYNVFICFFDEGDVGGDVIQGGNYYRLGEFENYIQRKKPCSVRIKFDTQEEFDYLIDHIYGFVTSLDVIAKHNRTFDLTPLEKCSELEVIQFYWNTKQETLWDVTKNTKLKYLQMMDYYKISDLSPLRGSSIQDLRLYGCNRCGSFVSKMHINDLSFILDMPNLRELRLDIIKDESSAYYLHIFAQCKHLRELMITDNFFTFQQFAWLKAQLPNVESGLDAVFVGHDFYSIIGRRTPKGLVDKEKTEKYQKRYDALVEKYKGRINPLADDEKD